MYHAIVRWFLSKTWWIVVILNYLYFFDESINQQNTSKTAYMYIEGWSLKFVLFPFFSLLFFQMKSLFIEIILFKFSQWLFFKWTLLKWLLLKEMTIMRDLIWKKTELGMTSKLKLRSECKFCWLWRGGGVTE